MTRDYSNLYKVMMLECHRGGFCSSHVCAQGAKANPLSAVLPALYKQPTFELRPLCNVIKVNTDSTGKQATGVTYLDARGREVEQPASIVILATYCFNNTRLLLLSGIGKPYDPQTGRGVVGRNYAYQTGGRVYAFFDDRDGVRRRYLAMTRRAASAFAAMRKPSGRSRSSSVVITCTGMWRVSGSCFNCESTVQPSMSGRKMSSDTAVGLYLRASASASAPRIATSALKP